MTHFVFKLWEYQQVSFNRKGESEAWGMDSGGKYAGVFLQVLDDPAASKFVSGTAVHWYFDDQYPASRLTKLHDLFPDKFILYTEASFSKYWLSS